MSEIQSRLNVLRQAVHRLGANAFYCALSDAHLSEYIQEADQLPTFLSGFTGSNAKLLVTDDEALLWTDSRYWEQAQNELDGSGIVLMKEGAAETPTASDWLKEKEKTTPIRLLAPLSTVSLSTYEALKESVTAILDFDDEAINGVWPNREPRVTNPLYIHLASSVSASDKLKRLQAFVSQEEKSHHRAKLLLTRLDDIAWLTNLRGSDIAFNPVFLSWALVGSDSATIFLNQAVLSDDIRSHLIQSGWSITDYGAIDKALHGLVDSDTSVLAKKFDLNAKLFIEIEKAWVECKHLVALWKSIKTPEEIAGLKRIMKADGKALEDFIDEVKARLKRKEVLTENDAVDILHAKRSAIPGFIGESFATIAAVNANAALPHYEPKPGQGAKITPPCILLVDSGAHYDLGTTDTTRVWFLGDPKDYPAEKLKALKKDYRAVYEAMKVLSEATFKPGTTGIELDKIARGPIHAIGADFGHGTGHGIGLTLNVHETPPNISPREREGTMTPFEPGMIVSDEPGIYRPGQWGIRIENMLVCVEKEDGLLGFETLTRCEIDKTLLL